MKIRGKILLHNELGKIDYVSHESIASRSTPYQEDESEDLTENASKDSKLPLGNIWENTNKQK